MQSKRAVPKRLKLEVQPQRKLNLPVRAQPNSALYGTINHAESATGQGGSKRLTGLQSSLPAP